MNAWNQWAMTDPIGAGIDLAHDALRDTRHDYGSTRAAAIALLAEGFAAWRIPAELADVREAIIAAARSELSAVAQ